MTRRLPEELENEKLIPLCLALRLSDAKKIESVFDNASIDYTFELTPITGKSVFSILFGSTKKGVIFLVPSDKYEFCRNLLTKEGLSHFIIEL
jgi:hypothetical protein